MNVCRPDFNVEVVMMTQEPFNILDWIVAREDILLLLRIKSPNNNFNTISHTFYYGPYIFVID